MIVSQIWPPPPRRPKYEQEFAKYVPQSKE